MPKLASFGLALSQTVYSARVFTPIAELTTYTVGTVPASVIGTMS